MSDTEKTLRQLAERCRRKHVPDRHELAAVALDLAADARGNMREYVTKAGELRSYADPNYQASHKGIEVAASLLLLTGKPGKEQPTEDDVERLARMGWSVSAKPGGGFELVPVAVPEGERVQ
jgi:hypothetical protein